MTKNKKAYYACGIHNNYLHNESGSYIKIEGIKSEGCYDGFSFDIWFYPDEHNRSLYTLFEQRVDEENLNFALSVQDGALNFSGKWIISYSSSGKLESRQWNHVFVSYDREYLSVYLNGYLCGGVTSMPGLALLDTPCIIGDYFNGFIRSVRVYATGEPFIYDDFSVESFSAGWRKYMHAMVYDEESMQDVLAWAGCVSGELKGEGPGGFPITVTACGDCQVCGVAYGYEPFNNRYLPIQNQAVVVNTVSGKQFSIYAKLLMKRDAVTSEFQMKKQVIFASGPWESEFSVILYLSPPADSASMKPVLWVKIGKETFKSGFEFSGDEWTDIVVTRLENTLILYVDHESQSFVIPPAEANVSVLEKTIYLGGLTGEYYYELIGYLGAVAVFDKALKQKDVDDFHENDPFIFEDNLVALYSFDFGAALELISGSEIDIPWDNGTLSLVSGTKVTEEKYQYRINKKALVYRGLWAQEKALLALGPITEYYRMMFALEASGEAINDVIEHFAEDLIMDPAILNFINKSPDPFTLSESEILNVIQAMNCAKNVKFLMAAQFDLELQRNEDVVAGFSFISILNFIIKNGKYVNDNASLKNADSTPGVINSIYDSLNTKIRDGRNNNKVFYACEIRQTTPDGSYIEVSGINSKQFSKGQFSFDIWFYSDEDDVSCEILSFEKKSDEAAYGWRFSVGADEKGHVYCVNGGEEFSIFTEEKPYEIGSNQWNNLFLIYDGTVMSFYLGGELIGNIDVGSDLSPHGPCFIAKGLDGFIRSVRFYDKAIFEEDIDEYLYLGVNPTGEYSEILAWIDFNAPEMRNMGRYFPEVSLHGYCGVRDVIYASFPKKSEETSIPILPMLAKGKTFSNENFSIYVKFFLPLGGEDTEEKQVIVEKQLDNDQYKMKIYLMKRREKDEIIFIPGIELTEESVCFEGKSKLLISGEWNEILAVRMKEDGETKIVLFINGEKETEPKKIEGLLVSSTPFSGYLTKLAVFDKALEGKDAAAFRENEPFIYENGLYNLFSFENGVPVELVSGSQVPEGWFPNVRLISNTNSWLRKSYRYRIAKEELSEDEDEDILDDVSWVLMILSDYYFETYGLVPDDDAVDDLIWCFGKEFLEEEWIRPLIEEDLNYDQIENVLETIDKSQHGRLMELLKFNKLENLLETNNNLEDVRGKSLGSIPALFWIGYAAVTAIVVMRNKAAAYCDKKKEERMEFRLISLTLQHNPAGFLDATENNPETSFNSAVYAQNSKGLIRPPEWQSKLSNGVKPAVYIADHLGKYVYIDAECLFLNNKGNDQTPRKIYLKGVPIADLKDPVFFSQLEGKTSGLVKPGVVFNLRLKATLRQPHPPCDRIRYRKDTYSWVYKVDDGEEKAIATKTELLIYTLPTTPSLPISLEEENTMCAPSIEFMNIIAKKMTVGGNISLLQDGDTPQPTPPLEEILAMLDRITNDIYLDSRFRYNGGNRGMAGYGLVHSDENMLGVHYFDLTAFQEILAQGRPPEGPIDLVCDSYAAILDHLFRYFLFLSEVENYEARVGQVILVRENSFHPGSIRYERDEEQGWTWGGVRIILLCFTPPQVMGLEVAERAVASIGIITL